MPKRYRGPISRPMKIEHVPRTRLAPKPARRSKIEYFLGIEEYREPLPIPIILNGNSAIHRIHVDDIVDPARLRLYLKEALDEINKNGFTASPTLQPLLDLRPSAAACRGAAISQKIDQEYHALMWQICAGKDIAPTFLSDALGKFLGDVEGLLALPGPKALILSYDLLIRLRTSSYGCLKKLAQLGHNLGKMELWADEYFDELQVKIFHKRRAIAQVWNYDTETGELENQQKDLRGLGVYIWYIRINQALWGGR